MTGMMVLLICLVIFLIIAIVIRLALEISYESERSCLRKSTSASYGTAQTTGGQEVQADCVQVLAGAAGIMGVVADGIGRENTGKLCSLIATDTIMDRYEPYTQLDNPDYFFRTAFYEANMRIQKTIGERRGGACMAAVFISGKTMHYALAGDLRIAILRGNELIPISKGQTMDVLAVNAYEDGRLSKKETIWSMDEKRTWNYLGMDGFREIEMAEQPIRLKRGDLILVVSKGIWQELSWGEIEDILLGSDGVQEKADQIVREADCKIGANKENGSVLIVEAEVSDEAD